MPFKSKQQARWAFATNQPFAKKWEDLTDQQGGIKSLPKRVTKHSVLRSKVGK